MRVVFSFVIILAAIFVVNAVYTKGHNGRPNCKSNDEINTIFWRNNNDPTTYWVCQNLNMPATAVDCPAGTGFMSSTKKCVIWKQWQWESPIDPPSIFQYEY